ncbi:MAG: hypothetical protein ABI581_08580 [Sediminibacterium sp.]
METGKTEQFANKIIAVSGLEIKQPGFNSIVMEKIFLAERKKAMRRGLLNWFLGLSSLGLIIFLTTLTIYQDNYTPVQMATNFLSEIKTLISENGFILLPLIVLYILFRLTNRKKIAHYLPDLNFE